MKQNKLYLWVASAAVFVLGRLIFSEIFSLGTLIGGIIYALVVGGFILPYIMGENMQIPSYAHILVKGKDSFARLVFLVLSILICLSAIYAP